MTLHLSFAFLSLVIAFDPAGLPVACNLQDKQEKKQGRPADQKKDRDAAAKEFATRQAALGEDDAAGHFALATWAEANALTSEAQRLLRKVIKLDPEHEEARTKLGFVKHEGQWLDEAEVKRQEEERYKREGYVKVNGEWVKKEEVEMAKKGLVRHEGKWITKTDKKQLDAGKVRHPLTGEWIAAADLPKAAEGKFPVGDQWVDKATADKLHADPRTPWSVVSEHFLLRGTFPFDKMEEARNEAEAVMVLAKSVFAQRLPSPGLPLQILLFQTRNEYADFVGRVSDTGLSTYGAFYVSRAEETPVAVFYGEKDWGPYYLKHGVGLLLANRFLEESQAKLPPVHWFATGIGSYLSRWANKGHAQYFGKQYVAKGGVRDLKSFFKSFDVGPDMPPEDMEWNIYQAGIMIAFCIDGGESKMTDALTGVNQALAKQKGVEAAIKKLESTAQGEEKALKAYLEKLVTGS